MTTAATHGPAHSSTATTISTLSAAVGTPDSRYSHHGKVCRAPVPACISDPHRCHEPDRPGYQEVVQSSSGEIPVRTQPPTCHRPLPGGRPVMWAAPPSPHPPTPDPACYNREPPSGSEDIVATSVSGRSSDSPRQAVEPHRELSAILTVTTPFISQRHGLAHPPTSGINGLTRPPSGAYPPPRS